MKSVCAYIAILIVVVGCNQPSTVNGNKSGNAYDTINCKIDTTLSELIITNHETTTLKDINIDLNYKYSHHVDSIYPGQFIKIPFAKFKDKKGIWYIDFKYGLTDLSLMCRYDDDQLGYAYRNFERY